MHKGKGGGLSDMFGGGMSTSMGGSSVAERNLTGSHPSLICGPSSAWFDGTSSAGPAPI
jgi:hypothetical protein